MISEPMKRLLIIFQLLLVVITTGCNTQSQTEEIKRSNRPVKAFSITEYSQFAGRSFPALTKAKREVELSFRVSGVLNKLGIQEGQFVHKGELIAALDSRDFEVRLQAAKASFDQAKAEKQRFERLLQSNSIPQNDYEIKLAQFIKAKAEFENAQNALSDTKLLAPFDGYIGKKFIENYQEIQAKQSVVNLIDLSVIEIRFHIPENLMIRKDKFESFQVQFENVPNIRFNASLKEIGKVAEAEGFPLTLVLDHQIAEGSTIENVSGLACRVIMNLSGQIEQAIVIPLAAVFEERDSNKHACWVIGSENKVQKRYINIGHFVSKDMVEVTSGLSLGETIVAGGVHFINEAQQVRIKQ